MKKIYVLVVLLFVTTRTISAQEETIGFTNPEAIHHLESYRLPTWGYDLFYLDLDGAITSINDFNDSKNRTTYGRINPTYLYYRESEELILDGRAQLPVRLDGVKNESAAGVESTISDLNATLAVSGDGKYYFQDMMFAAGVVGIDINTYRRKTDGDNQPETIRKESDTRFQIGAGAGYGKVRNVTPVIRALRFNERLNALDAGNLSDSQIQDVASIIAQRSGYQNVYDRPNKHFWNEVGNVVPDLFSNMDFYNAYYLSETLLETTGQRYDGWDVTGLLFLDHERYSYEQENDGTNILDDDGSATRYGINFAGRFFRNLSLEQMISVRANLGFGVQTYSDFDDSDNLVLAGLEVGHLYNITDRILVQSAISFNHEKISNDDYSYSDQILRLNSMLTYFIENNVAATVNLSYRNDKVDYGDGDQSRTNFGINFSLRYYFTSSLF